MSRLDTFKMSLPIGYQGRPMLAKYEGECSICECTILPGDCVLYNGSEKSIRCHDCATRMDDEP